MNRLMIIGATALALGSAPVYADSVMDIAMQSGACGSGAVTSATLDAGGSILVTCGDPVGVTQDSFPRLRNLLNGGGAGAGVGGAAAGAAGAAGGVTAFGGVFAQLALSVGLTAGSIAAGNAVGGATPNTTN
ncbi:hypothetical protein ACXN5S_01690 [Pseudoroseicyclus sp. H15]